MAATRRFNVYWMTPAIMIASLVAASAFAMGHHLYYSSLAGHTSPTGYFRIAGQSISQQQFHLSIGNTFAYLVKMFLSLAVSTAYLQAFWHFVRNKKKGATLSELDSGYSALSNILDLFRVRAWRMFPILLLLAVVSWCLNIASLITPATLSVQSILQRNSSMIQVPQFSFTTLNYVAGMQTNRFLRDDYTFVYSFNAASGPVQRTATAVAGIGQILPVPPPAPNTSWTLTEWAPTMQCSEVSGPEREQIWLNIWNSIGHRGGASRCDGSYAYLAWSPCAPDPHDHNLTTNMPFFLDPDSGDSAFCGSATSGSANVSRWTMSTELYVATLPALASVSFWSEPDDCLLFISPIGVISNYYDYTNCDVSLGYYYQNATDLNTTFNHGRDECPRYRPADLFQNASLTSCKFQNASMFFDFTYPDGRQDIKVRRDSSLPNSTFGSPLYVAGPRSGDMSDFPTVNGSTYSPLEAVDTFADQKELDCIFDPSVARQLSYVGIISAFKDLVLGLGDSNATGPSWVLALKAMNTILADTTELASLQNKRVRWEELQTRIRNGTQEEYRGLADELPRGSRGNIRTALEDLFQNFTISLLAQPYLQPNFSSPFAPERLTNVTSELTVNIYVYARSTLWVAYGLAILFACIIVGFGATVMLLHNASYNGNFSTIFRASRAAEISAELSHEDGNADEPLPGYLARARVRFSQGGTANLAGTSSDFETKAKSGNAVVTSRLLSRDDGASETSTLHVPMKGP